MTWKGEIYQIYCNICLCLWAFIYITDLAFVNVFAMTIGNIYLLTVYKLCGWDLCILYLSITINPWLCFNWKTNLSIKSFWTDAFIYRGTYLKHKSSFSTISLHLWWNTVKLVINIPLTLSYKKKSISHRFDGAAQVFLNVLIFKCF